MRIDLKTTSNCLAVFLFSCLMVFSVSSFAQNYTTNGNSKNSGKKTFWNEPREDRKSQNKPSIDYEANVNKEIKRYKLDAVPQIRNVAIHCTERWEGRHCFKALSQLSLRVNETYSKTLNIAEAQIHIEPLKQGCAASMSGVNSEITKTAMYEGMAGCVNTISNINSETTLKPDVNMYQLMVGSVLCLKPDDACKHIESQLKAFIP